MNPVCTSANHLGNIESRIPGRGLATAPLGWCVSSLAACITPLAHQRRITKQIVLSSKCQQQRGRGYQSRPFLWPRRTNSTIHGHPPCRCAAAALHSTIEHDHGSDGLGSVDNGQGLVDVGVRQRVERHPRLTDLVLPIGRRPCGGLGLLSPRLVALDCRGGFCGGGCCRRAVVAVIPARASAGWFRKLSHRLPRHAFKPRADVEWRQRAGPARSAAVDVR